MHHTVLCTEFGGLHLVGDHPILLDSTREILGLRGAHLTAPHCSVYRVWWSSLKQTCFVLLCAVCGHPILSLTYLSYVKLLNLTLLDSITQDYCVLTV